MRKNFMMMAGLLALTLLFAVQALAAERVTVRGRLAPTVEGGGWLINTGAQKYVIANLQRWRNETWFREGAEVEATGDTQPDRPNIYMEGVLFEVVSMRPVSGGNTAGGSRNMNNTTRIVVTGNATVQAQPDTAIINIAVVTQNASASEAQAENASRSEAVVRAVRAAAGTNAEVKTSGYSLQPQYIYKPNDAPTISGYQARNSVVVTMSELNKVGTVIDAATRAGANNIDGLSFMLKRDRPVRDQALTDATREAMDKARILAQALGGRVSRIVEVQEGGVARPPIIYARQEMMAARAGGADVSTPVEVGSLDITAQVQLVAEIETQQ